MDHKIVGTKNGIPKDAFLRIFFLKFLQNTRVGHEGINVAKKLINARAGSFSISLVTKMDTFIRRIKSPSGVLS